MASVKRLAGKMGVLRPVWWAYAAYLRMVKPTGMHVRTLVVRGDNEAFLLIKHTYRPKWFLPGGGIERGETAAEAAAREAWEEAGMRSPDAPDFVGLYLNEVKGRSDHIALFKITNWQREEVPSMEIAEAEFFTLDTLPEDTDPGARRRIEEALGRRAQDSRW